MAMVDKLFKMVLIMKEIGLMIWLVGKVNLFFQMDQNIKEILKTIKRMGKES